jgi:hypothetical protein
MLVAMSGASNSWQFGDQNAGGGGLPLRRVLRFGQKIKGDDVPTAPQRYRGVDGPSGKLVGARLRPSNGEAWLRLRTSDLVRPWNRNLRTIPLNSGQSPTPTLDVLELRGGMRVYCHDGYIGKLEGVATDARLGVVSDLLVHIRGDVRAAIESPTSPLATLLDVAGRRLLLPPAWANSTKHEESDVPFGGGLLLQLDATPEQIQFAMRLRPDGEVAADIGRILGENPAVAPYVGQVHVEVHDGDVTLSGSLPSVRHRASAEQDVWHIPGVFALRNEILVGG